jgi:hypothetical protein
MSPKYASIAAASVALSRHMSDAVIMMRACEPRPKPL